MFVDNHTGFTDFIDVWYEYVNRYHELEKLQLHKLLFSVLVVLIANTNTAGLYLWSYSYSSSIFYETWITEHIWNKM